MNTQAGLLMMLAMAAMCAMPLLVFAVLPVLGTLPGMLLTGAVVTAMLLLHFKFMHAGHRR